VPAGAVALPVEWPLVERRLRSRQRGRRINPVVEGSFRRCYVTTDVRRLLVSFDALSETEKHEAAVEVLRRLQHVAKGAVPDEALVEAADELFRELDAREAADAQSQPR
jgi:hypothetical protein